MRLEPSLKAQASYNIARAYARQGKTEESAGWLKRAVEAGFNDRRRVREDRDLESIKDSASYRNLTEKGDDEP